LGIFWDLGTSISLLKGRYAPGGSGGKSERGKLLNEARANSPTRWDVEGGWGGGGGGGGASKSLTEKRFGEKIEDVRRRCRTPAPKAVSSERVGTTPLTKIDREIHQVRQGITRPA